MCNFNPGIRDTVFETTEQNCLSLTEYYAESSLQETTFRVANIGTGLAALYGTYSIFTGPVGVISYAAMALALRKCTSTLLGYLVYPSAIESTVPCINTDYLNSNEEAQLESLQDAGFIVKKNFHL